MGQVYNQLLFQHSILVENLRCNQVFNHLISPGKSRQYSQVKYQVCNRLCILRSSLCTVLLRSQLCSLQTNRHLFLPCNLSANPVTSQPSNPLLNQLLFPSVYHPVNHQSGRALSRLCNLFIHHPNTHLVNLQSTLPLHPPPNLLLNRLNHHTLSHPFNQARVLHHSPRRHHRCNHHRSHFIGLHTNLLGNLQHFLLVSLFANQVINQFHHPARSHLINPAKFPACVL